MFGAPFPAGGSPHGRAHATSTGRWPALLVLFAGLLAAPAARADQTDARLDGLFSQLKSAETDAAAHVVEARIWEIWMESGDESIDGLMTIGVVAMNGNNYDRAFAAFSRIVALKPRFAEGWNKRATALYLLGRFDDSIKDIDRVLALEPRHFGALSGLGLCNAELNQDQAALDAFTRALAVDPNMSSVKANIEELKKRIARHSI
jgi:tetratricopeptide (TPR) repeat protein